MNGMLAQRHRAGRRGRHVAAAGLAIAIAPGLATIAVLLGRGLPALRPGFLLGPPADFLRDGGIGPALWGTLVLAAGALAVALPLGVGAAIFLGEFLPPGPLARFLRAGLGGLAAVPSVVMGLFGLAAFVLGLRLGVSVLAGSLTLALLALPLVAAAAESALRAVPQPVRTAAAALGLSRWHVVRHVVLPAAAPGMVTGALLALARVTGEVAPLLFTGAALWRPGFVLDPRERTMVLAYHVHALATQVPGVPAERIHAAALVLVALSVAAELAACGLAARAAGFGDAARPGGR